LTSKLPTSPNRFNRRRRFICVSSVRALVISWPCTPVFDVQFTSIPAALEVVIVGGIRLRDGVRAAADIQDEKLDKAVSDEVGKKFYEPRGLPHAGCIEAGWLPRGFHDGPIVESLVDFTWE